MIGLLQPEHTGRYADLTFPSYRAALHSAESIIAVSASVGGAAAGLGLARIDGDVLSIAVRDAHRRQGIGRALLARLEEELSAAGAACRDVYLHDGKHLHRGGGKNPACEELGNSGGADAGLPCADRAGEEGVVGTDGGIP